MTAAVVTTTTSAAAGCCGRAAAGAAATGAFAARARPPFAPAAAAVGAVIFAAPSLPPYPLAGVAKAARAAAAGASLRRPTGLTNADHLAVARGIVRYFVPHQNGSTGAIIDPVTREETQFATPMFAHAAAAVFAAGLDDDLLGPAAGALDAALRQLATQTCASGHANFFALPTVEAVRLLAPHVPAARAAGWRALLAGVDPHQFRNNAHNWGVGACEAGWAAPVEGGGGATHIWSCVVPTSPHPVPATLPFHAPRPDPHTQSPSWASSRGWRATAWATATRRA